MKGILVAALLLIACRTQPVDAPDLAGTDLAGIDLSTDLATADLAPRDPVFDLATSDGAVPCGSSSCNGATEVCVFMNRGDCAKYECAPLPAACRADRTCNCLGDEFCNGLGMPGETLVCTPNATFPAGPDTIVCTSTIQCV